MRAWSSTTDWASGRWHHGLAALITAVLLWAQASVYPDVTLDSSWQAGLALARIHDLHWGPQVLFTYGPLGFLQNSANYSYDQSLVATLYQPIVVGALFLGVAAALRLRHPPKTSLLGAFLTTAVIAVVHIGHGSAPGLEYPELAFLAAFAWLSVPLLQTTPQRRTVFRVCVAVGALAGLQLLIKFNIGLSIALTGLVTSILLDWKDIRRHCATLASFGMSFVLFWLLAGQRLQDLPGWLRYSGSVVNGYSEAMSVPLNVYTAAALVVSVTWILALTVVWVSARTQTTRRFVILAGLATAICARAALGRSDIWHFYVLIGIIIAATVIMPFPSRWRRVIVILIGFVLAVNSLGMAASGYGAYDQVTLALQAPSQAVDRLVTLTVPGRLNERIEQTKARQRALYAIPERFLNTIGSAAVHIDPSQTSAAWAYDLAWSPAPVFQTYQANTPALDGLNSESIATSPQFVLSRLSPAAPAIGLDGRLGVQESPRYSRTLLCDYRLEGIEKQWALFARTNPHCGSLTPLSEVDVRGNDAVSVPAPSGPDMAVLVAIELEPNIVDRLFQGLIAPLMVPTVRANGTAYRLIAANAAEPFLVVSPTAVAGTNLQIHAHDIGIGRAPSLIRSEAAARLRFYEMNTGQIKVGQPRNRTPEPPQTPKTVIDPYGRSSQVIDRDGTYLVGVDVLPGKYRSTGGPMCHWARLRSPDPTDEIASNTSNSPQEIRLALSDTSFRTQDCATWQWLPE